MVIQVGRLTVPAMLHLSFGQTARGKEVTGEKKKKQKTDPKANRAAKADRDKEQPASIGFPLLFEKN